MEIGQLFFWLRGRTGDWAFVNKDSKLNKMAAQSEPDREEIISGIKRALRSQKSKFERRISNVHKLRDLDQTFKELGKVAEAVVNGPPRNRHQHEISHVYLMLERTMVRAKNGIFRRLSPRMSKIHPWMVCLDIPMPHEVFHLLNKGIVNRTN